MINSVLLTSPAKLLTTSPNYTFRCFVMFAVCPESKILLHIIKPLEAHPLEREKDIVFPVHINLPLICDRVQ